MGCNCKNAVNEGAVPRKRQVVEGIAALLQLDLGRSGNLLQLTAFLQFVISGNIGLVLL